MTQEYCVIVARNTTELIENSVKEVDSGVSNAVKTAEVLKEISEGIFRHLRKAERDS